jgi:hypothetical protein
MKSRCYSLRELTQLRPFEHLPEFRLSDQYYLEQLATVGLQVGEQPKLFKYRGAEDLRLVYDQQCPASGCVGLQQVIVDTVDEVLDAGLSDRVFDAYFFAYGGEQLFFRQSRIQDEGRFTIFGELIEHAATNRGLSGADLSCKKDKSAIRADSVNQVCQGLAMPSAHV